MEGTGERSKVLQGKWENSGLVMENHLCLVLYLVAQLVKNLPEMQETPVQFLSQEDPQEKG